MASQDPPARVLSGLDAAALAAGIMIGTGIFVVPGYVAEALGSPGLILIAWVLGGVIALCGALTYAELGSLFPYQGGSFVYVLRAFGPFAAFFKGWGSFLVGYPASCAGIAAVFGQHVGELTGSGPLAQRAWALAAITAVWWMNLRGTKFSAKLQTSLTAAKVLALLFVATLALFVGAEGFARLFASEPSSMGSVGTSIPGAGAWAIALVPILWTLDGWQNLTVVSGEIGNPQRGIVRGLIAAVTTVVAIYLILNVAYLVLLPMEELAGEGAVAARAAEQVLGSSGRRLLAALIVVSSFGALFGISMAGPRYFYAMANAGLFFERAGRLDPRNAAPRWGATVLFGTTVAYSLAGTFDQIMAYYVAITLIYNVLSMSSIFRLRGMPDLKDAPGVFRTPGYPIVPLVFIVAATWITFTQIRDNPKASLLGVTVLAASVPVYFLWRRRVGTKKITLPGREA